jgi:hypothetical protein
MSQGAAYEAGAQERRTERCPIFDNGEKSKTVALVLTGSRDKQIPIRQRLRPPSIDPCICRTCSIIFFFISFMGSALCAPIIQAYPCNWELKFPLSEPDFREYGGSKAFPNLLGEPLDSRLTGPSSNQRPVTSGNRFVAEAQATKGN